LGQSIFAYNRSYFVIIVLPLTTCLQPSHRSTYIGISKSASKNVPPSQTENTFVLIQISVCVATNLFPLTGLCGRSTVLNSMRNSFLIPNRCRHSSGESMTVMLTHVNLPAVVGSPRPIQRIPWIEHTYMLVREVE